MGRSQLTVAVAHRYTLKEHRLSHKYGYISTHTVRLDNRFIMDRLRYIIQRRDLSLENKLYYGSAASTLLKAFLYFRGYQLKTMVRYLLERSRLPRRIVTNLMRPSIAFPVSRITKDKEIITKHNKTEG